MQIVYIYINVWNQSGQFRIYTFWVVIFTDLPDDVHKRPRDRACVWDHFRVRQQRFCAQKKRPTRR